MDQPLIKLNVKTVTTIIGYVIHKIKMQTMISNTCNIWGRRDKNIVLLECVWTMCYAHRVFVIYELQGNHKPKNQNRYTKNKKERKILRNLKITLKKVIKL